MVLMTPFFFFFFFLFTPALMVRPPAAWGKQPWEPGRAPDLGWQTGTPCPRPGNIGRQQAIFLQGERPPPQETENLTAIKSRRRKWIRFPVPHAGSTLQMRGAGQADSC